MSKQVDVLAVRWVAELAVHPNGMHEIRAAAVNACERPLVAFAASYELAKAVADAHNRSAAVAELMDKADNAATALSNLIAARQVDCGYSGVVTDLTAALARCKGSAA